MPERVFSAARLQAHRVVEAEGVSDAVRLEVLNTQLAARLWLPLSLIELAFRNSLDTAVAAVYTDGDWLLAAGANGDVIDARQVRGSPFLCGVDDPVAAAAIDAAEYLGKNEISRGDIIARLTLGFWVYRAPEGLAREGILIYDVLSSGLPAPLDTRQRLQQEMGNLLLLRNRVAHHEPILFRKKHMYSKHGEAKRGADLVTSLQSAIEKFLAQADGAVETARALAPVAADYLDPLPDAIRGDVQALQERLAARVGALREARDRRLAEQKRIADEKRAWP